MEKANDLDIRDEDLMDVEDFTPEELEAEDADWKAKATERTGIAKRRTTQLKKAKDLIDAQKAEIETLKKPPEPKPQDKKPEGFDYGQLAYLKANGIENDEFDFVQEEIERSKFELKDLLDNEYFKQKLESRREEAKVKNATPKSSKRSDGGAKDLVDYHISKGTPLEEITDQKLRREIVNKRLERSKSDSKFTDNPVVQ